MLFSMCSTLAFPHCVQKSVLYATPWTAARQAPLPLGLSRQEYWSGLPFPSPQHLPDPGTKPGSPTLQGDSLLSELPGKPDTIKGNSKLIMSFSLILI